MYAGTDAKGKDLYKPGCVHCKLTYPSEWKSKYVFLSFDAKRAHIIKALRFCILNNGMGFNQRGFNANLFVPGGLGVRRWDESLMTQRREYFAPTAMAGGTYEVHGEFQSLWLPESQLLYMKPSEGLNCLTRGIRLVAAPVVLKVQP